MHMLLSLSLLSGFLSLALADYSLVGPTRFLTLSDMDENSNIPIGLSWSPKNPVDVYYYSDSISVGGCSTTLPAGTTYFTVPFRGYAYSPDVFQYVNIRVVERETCNQATGALPYYLLEDFYCRLAYNFIGEDIDPPLDETGQYEVFSTSTPVPTENGPFSLRIMAAVGNVDGVKKVTQMTVNFNGVDMTLNIGQIADIICPSGLQCRVSSSYFEASVPGFFELSILDRDTYLYFTLIATVNMQHYMGSGACVPTSWGDKFRWFTPDLYQKCTALDSLSTCGPAPNSPPTTQPPGPANTTAPTPRAPKTPSPSDSITGICALNLNQITLSAESATISSSHLNSDQTIFFQTLSGSPSPLSIFIESYEGEMNGAPAYLPYRVTIRDGNQYTDVSFDYSSQSGTTQPTLYYTDGFWTQDSTSGGLQRTVTSLPSSSILLKLTKVNNDASNKYWTILVTLNAPKSYFEQSNSVRSGCNAGSADVEDVDDELLNQEFRYYLEIDDTAS